MTLPWNLVLKGVAAIAMLGLLTYGVSEVKTFFDNYATMKDNLVKLDTGFKAQQVTIKEQEAKWAERNQKDAIFQHALEEQAKTIQENRSETRRLDRIFAKHDLEALAHAKPQLVEDRINRGTVDIIRMLNSAGSIESNVHTNPVGKSSPATSPPAAPPRAN
jgi:hypothetical protein